jgi:hypothetical protein
MNPVNAGGHHRLKPEGSMKRGQKR